MVPDEILEEVVLLEAIEFGSEALHELHSL
jgi:hypothetical protein